jgi:hypothetical protein
MPELPSGPSPPIASAGAHIVVDAARDEYVARMGKDRCTYLLYRIHRRHASQSLNRLAAAAELARRGLRNRDYEFKLMKRPIDRACLALCDR